MAGTWQLEAEDLNKSYVGRKVVNNVTLGLNAGEVVGLLGPNGAGKTTTFYMMVGLVKPESGYVYLDGQDLSKAPLHMRARAGIGYLPQEPSTFRRLSVEENLYLIWEMLDPPVPNVSERLEKLLAEFGLTQLRNQTAVALSGGERRRLEIARAMATEPRYLLLDEPFTGVDPLHVSEIQTIVGRLKANGIGVLITDHNAAALLEIVDRVYIISEGKILVHGTPREVVANDLARKYYLGDRFFYPEDRRIAAPTPIESGAALENP
jgi:lipopolysaccharide export system ATP-binding protein